MLEWRELRRSIAFEGYAIEGSPRDAMSAILAKNRENKFSGLRKSWGVSPAFNDYRNKKGRKDVRKLYKI